jgi:hypothetical protein
MAMRFFSFNAGLMATFAHLHVAMRAEAVAVGLREGLIEWAPWGRRSRAAGTSGPRAAHPNGEPHNPSG